MKTIIFPLVIACTLFIFGCQELSTQPPAPVQPSTTKPTPPENVGVYLITPSLSNLTWKYPGQNVDGFLISRGNSKIGWTDVITVWGSTREYHDPLPRELVGVDGTYYLVTAISSGVKSDTAMSNNLGMFRAYHAN